MNYVWLAQHPYTHQAKDAIEQINPALTDELLLKARDKLINLLTYNLEKVEYVSDKQAKEDLILYPVIRLLASQMNYVIIHKIAIAYSKLWVNVLKKEGIDTAVQLLDINIKVNEKSRSMHFTDYVIDMPHEHKLVNMPLNKGYVYLNEKELWAVIQKHLERTFIETLPKVKNAKAKKFADAVVSKIPIKHNVRISNVSEMAPCMKEIISKLNKGENVPHIARWVIAVYLARIGWSEDAIVSVFSKTPNFNPLLTQYHVRYIIEKKYAVPSCESLKSYGLCIGCGAKSPMSFKGHKKKDEKDKTGVEEHEHKN
ncbi:hypothetical protein J7J90_01645 [Candidatus Micrarchaeota archaeon]|nr:hypothetical protein [Candidatus Micrarchaeota archaeon]